MVGQRRKVKLERWTQSKDANGRWVESIQSSDNIFAEVTFLSGSRSSTNGQTNVNNNIRFKIRYNELDIKAKWKVVYSGKRYSITSMHKEDGKRFYWILDAQS
jgi:SPP1 family predicted phage head-tail adaptor